MVRHHVKKSKKKSLQKRDGEKKEMEKRLKDLDRFAGSSEEDNDDDDSVDVDVDIDDTSDEGDENINNRDSMVDGEETNDDGEESDGENNNAEDQQHANNNDSSSDEDEYHGGSTMNRNNYDSDENDSDESIDGRKKNDAGDKVAASQMKMAFAMSKILGLSSSHPTPSVSTSKAPSTTITTTTQAKNTPILSKTITPLQKMQKKEAQKIQELKLKRKQRRETNLIALHKPLSAATSTFHPKNSDNNDSGASSLAKEIKAESMHRRVATRGVVALFNTIAKHQQEQYQAKEYGNRSNMSSGKEQQVKSMTKFGFLDMLKQTAADKNPKDGNGDNVRSKINSEKESSSASKKKPTMSSWNALKDDFMMNSKLKDWDKELSGEEDDSDADGIVDDYEDDDSVADKGKERKRTHRGDLDDMMDDDSSSSDDEAIKRKSNAKRRKRIS